MKIVCEVELVDSPHLYQLYSGFIKLESLGIVSLKFIKNKTINKTLKPVIKVKVNKTINIIYDLLDGFNWIPGTREENLKHFQTSCIDVDYYFKRSYNEELLRYNLNNCKIMPLGLFYRVEKLDVFKNKLKVKARRVLEVLQMYEQKELRYEALPVFENLDSMLFTRLWDPNDVNSKTLKEERELINFNRIESIEACREKFGKYFSGGISDTPFARKTAKHLVLNQNLTNRRSYLMKLKETPINIVNLGLFGSTGGRFAESVAASRAIITEFMRYEVPGKFQEENNYLEFSGKDTLLEKVDLLLSSPEKVRSMMFENYKYYNTYLKPENLVLNSLLRIFHD
ncbi:hypothetical protein [Flavicella sp.]|uniref:hypothetical protein n=1 Tax=Flavicella sp. TaxID=2957742 RepID=UPI002603C29D|nr:hypothetical protein [Flavicella sp.]MDG1804986.1 hypothetical protein [Flavicella sp.]MDG2280351.1 hypothetical protein [Flavicella sp.]